MRKPSAVRIRILSAGLLLFSMACWGGKDFGDFYTRAWYLVVDNPGASSRSGGVVSTQHLWPV